MKRAKLQAARYRKGLSQEALAEQIGVSRNAVSQWENGHTIPYPLYVGKLCVFFEVDDPAALDLQMRQDETSDAAAKLALEPKEQRPYQAEAHSSSPPFLEAEPPQEAMMQDASQKSMSENQEQMVALLAQRITQEILEALSQRENHDIESDQTVDRREAAKQIGMFSLSVLTTPQKFLTTRPTTVQPKHPKMNPEMFRSFETLTETCLHLSEGSQLGIAERVLWSYLPDVEAMAQQSSVYQERAATITAQGYLIAASLVGHHNDLQARKQFSEQAWLYANLAQDRTLQVAALRQLAVTFDYLERPHKVLQTYQHTFPYLDEVSPLLRACVYAAISGVYAQLQQKQETYRCIGLAYEHFPEHQEDEPSYLRLINASYTTVVLWDGLNHLELGQPHIAEKTLAQIEVLTPTKQIPERIRSELLNYQAKTYVAVAKMEQACTYLEAACHASLEIGSERRLRESFTVLEQIRGRWPNERKVQHLRALFAQSPIYHAY
jgi:transcriptional regulator with XRE-family HTH domain